MKIINVGISAIGILWVFAAQTVFAAPPVYHINHSSFFYTGTATIQSSGKVCAFKKQVYKNAELGDVYTSSNTFVGYGFVSEFGELLALSNDDVTSMLRISTHAHGHALMNMTYTFFMDINNVHLTDYIMNSYTSDSCAIQKLFSDPKSQISYNIDYYTFKPTKISLRYGFYGINNPEEKPLRIGGFEHQKRTFSGVMTFSGDGQYGNPGFFP